MLSILNNRFFFTTALLIVSLYFFTACDEQRQRGPDFSAVPDPVDISGITPDTLGNGTLIYVTREGVPDLGGLNVRDRALMRYSIWRDAGRGNVRDSSYQGQFLDPVFVDVLTLAIGDNVPINTGSYFRFMVAGMLPGEEGENESAGEFRVALVPPSVTGLSDTLRYDLELFEIID